MSLMAFLAAGVLYGTATIGPVTPVCRVNTPCTRPAKNDVLVFSRAGRSISTRTDAKGRYRVRLPVGTWTVRSRAGRSLTPVHVRVVAGRRRVDIAIDTGIR